MQPVVPYLLDEYRKEGKKGVREGGTIQQNCKELEREETRNCCVAVMCPEHT